MSLNLESEIDVEFDEEEADEIRRKAEAIRKLAEARVIIEKACDEALPLIDDEFLADNYEADSTDFILATVKSSVGYSGRIWPSEEVLIRELF